MSKISVAPSKAHVWSKCPGSPSLSATVKRESNDSADEGIIAHELCEKILNGEEYQCDNDEMLDAAKTYVEYVWATCQDEPDDMGVEDKLEVFPHCNVIIDCWVLKGDHLHIYDFKYGFGLVDVYKNPQLSCGAGALIKRHKGIKKVTCHIVQPRGFHHDGPCRSWECGVGAIIEIVSNLEEIAKEIFSPSPRCITGDHCRFCPAMHKCPTNRQATMSALDYIGAPLSVDVDPSDEFKVLDRALRLIKDRHASLEAQLVERIRGGEAFDGYELKTSFGHTKWNDDAETIIAMGKEMGIELQKSVTAVTPAEAKRRGFTVDGMTYRPQIGEKLVKLNLNSIERKLQNVK